MVVFKFVRTFLMIFDDCSKSEKMIYTCIEYTEWTYAYIVHIGLVCLYQFLSKCVSPATDDKNIFS